MKEAGQEKNKIFPVAIEYHKARFYLLGYQADEEQELAAFSLDGIDSFQITYQTYTQEIAQRYSYQEGKRFLERNGEKIDKVSLWTTEYVVAAVYNGTVNGDMISGLIAISYGFQRKIIRKEKKYGGKEKEILTAGELCAVIRGAIPMKVQKSGGNPAKRTFQAIRIACNRELDVLKDSLDDMIDLLNDGGRICVITFHSLEDRIVKTIFKKNENPCICPPDFPVCVCGRVSKGKAVRKPVVPSEEEWENNKRSRSAKLRVFERKEQ